MAAAVIAAAIITAENSVNIEKSKKGERGAAETLLERIDDYSKSEVCKPHKSRGVTHLLNLYQEPSFS